MRTLFIMLLALGAGIIYIGIVMKIACFFSMNDRKSGSEEKADVCKKHLE